MKRNIDLSIIVPIYNVAEYLEECLESIYSLNIEKEIIMVNDGSTDSSALIAEKYKKKYPNITTLISQKNKGVSEAKNVALYQAKGEYIYFIDSDDFILSEKFEVFFSKIKGTDLDIIRGIGVFYKEKEREPIRVLENLFSKIKKPKSKILRGLKMFYKFYKEQKEISIQESLEEIVPFETMTGKEFIMKLFDIDDYRDYVWLNIYRHDYLLENNFSFQKGITFEDRVFSFQVYWNAKNIRQESDNFYKYRIRKKGNSITQKPKIKLDHLYVNNFLLDYILEKGISHTNITKLSISRVRELSKDENVFNQEMYRKLWKLPKKNWISIIKLLDLSWRKYFNEKISYEQIEEISKNNR